ncbi:hypothetical protein AKJ16_DCAP01256 [Drosera capensis]
MQRPPIVGILTRHDFTPEHKRCSDTGCDKLLQGTLLYLIRARACCRNWESTARFTLGSVVASELLHATG